MFKHILVPTDGSELSDKAAEKAVAFAKEIGAKVTFFCAEERFPVAYAGAGGAVFDIGAAGVFQETQETFVKDTLEAAVGRAQAAQVACDSVSLVADEPYLGIIEAATKNGCDLIYMGSRGRGGLAGILLGSQAKNVLTHSKIPVLVHR